MSGRIETYSGGSIDPIDPTTLDINPVDIAHALGNICRFTGHVRHFYSVAQHSVLVASLLDDPELHLWGLLHDAAEAYVCDVARPVKPRLRGYQAIEDRLLYAVAARFDLVSWTVPSEVKHADAVLLATERRDLMPGNDPPWGPVADSPAPMDEVIVPLSPPQARAQYSLALNRALGATGRATF